MDAQQLTGDCRGIDERRWISPARAAEGSICPAGDLGKIGLIEAADGLAVQPELLLILFLLHCHSSFEARSTISSTIEQLLGHQWEEQVVHIVRSDHVPASRFIPPRIFVIGMA